MPTLKQLVDGAIKAGSKFAFPRLESRQNIANLVPNSWTANTFTAPCDGTIVAFVYGTPELYLGVLGEGAFVSGTSLTSAANYLTDSVSLRKGDACRMFYAKPTGDAHFSFYPSMGSS